MEQHDDQKVTRATFYASYVQSLSFDLFVKKAYGKSFWRVPYVKPGIDGVRSTFMLVEYVYNGMKASTRRPEKPS